MYNDTATSLEISIGCLAVLALASAPHASYAAQLRLRAKAKYQALTEKYEDEDGTATVESQKAFSDRPQRLILVFASLTAAGLAAASAVLTLTGQKTAHDERLVIQQWLQLASWVR